MKAPQKIYDSLKLFFRILYVQSTIPRDFCASSRYCLYLLEEFQSLHMDALLAIIDIIGEVHISISCLSDQLM